LSSSNLTSQLVEHFRFPLREVELLNDWLALSLMLDHEAVRAGSEHAAWKLAHRHHHHTPTLLQQSTKEKTYK
jgi:hypothetical protein